jgi:DNA helicase-2/ATP-dependent DNA helicase PcrA
MGVSAVPGSGKTHILSYLASRLVQGHIDDNQEVLIVTMMNSSVDNFTYRVAGFLQQEAGLLPNIGYRVRTLHGLAVDIVRERPGLVGLSEQFTIVDEREARRTLTDIVQAWVGSHPEVLLGYLDPAVEEGRQSWIRREKWPELVRGLAEAFIKRAKDLRLTPRQLAELLRDRQALPLARMGLGIYERYQRALQYRGAVDFDDLIVLALDVLEEDPDLLARLQHRWPFILEDEAQDSSRLQQEILQRLAGPDANWVRVGDPNQSVHTTFTTANPELLREFMASPEVFAVTMPSSGRSTPAIIDLANHLVDWAVNEHPEPACRDAFYPQHIEPTPPGDPQPNPSGEARVVYLDETEYTPERELRVVADSLARWVPEHPEETVAVLVPRNHRGFQMAEALRARDVPFLELLQSTLTTRQTAGVLVHIMRYLADSGSVRKLSRVFEVWRRDEREDEELAQRNQAIVDSLRNLQRVEDFLWPRLERDWLAEAVGSAEDDSEVDAETMAAHALLIEFRALVRRWQRAATLPVDQLILTLGGDLFDDSVSLALVHKLATVMRHVSDDNPAWRLPELTEELAVIARNERRFLGFDAEDAGFEPPPGVVTVTTMHKAKGLEWDRVYLMSVNNYSFPSDMPNDSYIGEKWYIRDQLNLEEEALAQLEMLADPYKGYEEGRASLLARQDYSKERLRLFYVGITRARRDLIITWNNGRRGTSRPSLPLIALQTYWEEIHDRAPTSA